MINRSLLPLALAVGVMCCSPGAARAQGYAGAPKAPLNPLRALSKAQLKAFIEQPLFDPSRRLPPPPPPAPLPVEMPPPVAPPPPPPDVRLVGFIYSKEGVAIYRLQDGGPTLQVRSGDSIGDWKATVLPGNTLRIVNGTREMVFTLFKYHGPSNLMPDGSIPETGYSLEQTMTRRSERLKNRRY